jgi:hypothetical protein
LVVLSSSQLKYDTTISATGSTREAMTSSEREKPEEIARKAKLIRDAWLREREEARAVQISANDEVRRGWREIDDQDEAPSARTPHRSRRGR